MGNSDIFEHKWAEGDIVGNPCLSHCNFEMMVQVSVEQEVELGGKGKAVSLGDQQWGAACITVMLSAICYPPLSCRAWAFYQSFWLSNEHLYTQSFGGSLK